jgi:hypothetical protein
VALIGFGVFIQSENLTMAAAQVTHLFGISARCTQTLGVLLAVGLAASHALQAYFFDHQEFLRSLYQISLSFWPLLAVIAGALLLRDGSTEEVEELQKRSGGLKKSGLTCRFRRGSFDA